MTLTVINDGKIAVQLRDDESVWVCLNYDKTMTNTWYPTQCEFNPYAFQAVLDYWTPRRSKNYAERLLIAVIQKPEYTIWHACMGVDPNTPSGELHEIEN